MALAKIREYLSYDPGTGVLHWIKTKRAPINVGDVAGTPTPQGYISVGFGGRNYKAHRLAWLFCHGALPPPGTDMDHINGVKSDNRIANLRLATRSQNNANSPKPSHNTSGYKGVAWHKGGKKWQAGIKVNGKRSGLGLFDSAEAAAMAYDAAARETFGAYARTNFGGQ